MRKININIIDDNRNESREHFRVAISNARNEPVANALAISDLYINDNDSSSVEVDYNIPYPFDTDDNSITITQYPGGNYSHDGDFASGYDFALPRFTQVLAVASGVVVDFRESVADGQEGSSGMGNFVTIRFNSGQSNEFYGTYLHLEPNSVPLAIGQNIAEGDVVGMVGRTGITTGPHLHFQAGSSTKTYGYGTADNTIIFADGSGDSINLISFFGQPTTTPVGTSINFSVGNASGFEGQTFSVPISTNTPLDRDVLLTYSTVPVTASSGDGDYLGFTQGKILMRAGESQINIPISVLEDGKSEPDQTFQLHLVDTSYGSIVDSFGTLTIRAPSTPAEPRVSIQNAQANEGEIIRFEVRLNEVSDQAVNVDYTVHLNGAASNADINATNGSVTIAAGEIGTTIDFTTLNDSISDPAELFLVRLSNASGATISAGSTTAVGTINEITNDALIAAKAENFQLEGEFKNMAAMSQGLFAEVFEVANRSRYDFKAGQLKIAEGMRIINLENPTLQKIIKFNGLLKAAIDGLSAVNTIYEKGLREGGPEAIKDLALGLISGLATQALGVGVAVALFGAATVGAATLPAIATVIVVGGFASYFVGEKIEDQLEPYFDQYFGGSIEASVDNFADLVDASFDLGERVIDWTNDQYESAKLKAFQLLDGFEAHFYEDHSTQNNDVLIGTSQTDSIDAKGGSDIIVHTAGGDTIEGGNGNDTISYLARAKGGVINLLEDTGVTDFVKGFFGGGSATGDFTYAVTEKITGVENVIGSKFNDKISGDHGSNKLFGNAGADKLIGNGGADDLRGGSGNDKLFGGSGGDQLRGDDGNDYLQGGSGNDRLVGGFGADIIFGNHGKDKIIGGDGRDKIYGGSSGDQLLGGNGHDIIMGESGKDKIYGGHGNDYLNGGSENDQLFGNLGIDILIGEDGDDWLDGGRNSDKLVGGSGRDTLIGGNGDDSLFGNRGTDWFDPGEGADKIDGGAGFDRVWYGDSLGGVDVDLFEGKGSKGNAEGDRYFNIERATGSEYTDTITGNNITNWLKGGAGRDTILGGGGRDILEGGQGRDVLYGNAGNDRLFGGSETDSLFGNRGKDQLDGGLGNDYLTGGNDIDYFVFKTENDQGFGWDYVTDFQDGADRLDVRDVYSVNDPSITANSINNFLVTDTASGAKVKFEAGQVIYLSGIDAENIDASDFIFA